MTRLNGKPCKKCGGNRWSATNSWVCLSCHAERNRQHYAENAQSYKDRAKEWKKSNPERAAEHNRKQSITHKEKNSVRARERYYANWDRNKEESRLKARMAKDKRKVFLRIWRKLNPDKTIAQRHTRRTRVADGGGSYTPEEWEQLCNHYGNKCLGCGRNDVKMTVDHIKPVSLGGSSDISNLQPLCKNCNSRKGNRHIDYRPDAGPLRWLQAKLFGALS